MHIYHKDDFMARYDIVCVLIWFEINVVLKLVQGQGLSNISVNLSFSKTFPTLISLRSDISFV